MFCAQETKACVSSVCFWPKMTRYFTVRWRSRWGGDRTLQDPRVRCMEVVALCPTWLCGFPWGGLLECPVLPSLYPAPQRGKGGLLVLTVILTFGQEENPCEDTKFSLSIYIFSTCNGLLFPPVKVQFKSFANSPTWLFRWVEFGTGIYTRVLPGGEISCL